jgi:hypothetical protein
MDQIRLHHRFAFPRDLDEIHWKADQGGEDSLPFMR